MPRVPTGNVYFARGNFIVRVTIGKKRPRFVLSTCQTQEQADERGAIVASVAARLRASGHDDVAEGILTRVATAAKGRALDAVLVAVDRVVAGSASVVSAARAATFQEFCEDWTEGRLAERWPDHVKRKASSIDDRERARLHIYPTVGHILLTDFKIDHADAVMSALDSDLSPASRRHVAQIIRRVLQMAVYPARIIPGNPLPRGFLPSIGAGKAMTYLYPAEDAQLLGCRAVPLAHRVLYGFLAREGMRRSEAERLEWGDIDLERGIVTLDQTKTDDARAWALDPGVARALVTWRALLGSPRSGERVFGMGLTRAAAVLREHLTLAKVDRKALFERSAQRQPIRVHDLRATFITISLANGRSETWVMDRTGHTTSAMVNRYRRAARSLAEIGAGELMGLDVAIPELVEASKPPAETVTATETATDAASGMMVAQAEATDPACSESSARGRGRTGTPVKIADFESEGRASNGSKPCDSQDSESPNLTVQSVVGSTGAFEALRFRCVDALTGLLVEAVEAGDEVLADVLIRAIRDPLFTQLDVRQRAILNPRPRSDT